MGITTKYLTPQVVDTLDPEYYYGAVKYKDGSWATTKWVLLRWTMIYGLMWSYM